MILQYIFVKKIRYVIQTLRCDETRVIYLPRLLLLLLLLLLCFSWIFDTAHKAWSVGDNRPFSNVRCTVLPAVHNKKYFFLPHRSLAVTN
jgi:hypothetical protein